MPVRLPAMINLYFLRAKHHVCSLAYDDQSPLYLLLAMLNLCFFRAKQHVCVYLIMAAGLRCVRSPAQRQPFPQKNLDKHRDM